MKLKNFSFVFLLLLHLSPIASIAQSGFVATGGNSTDGGQSLSFTIGQIDYLNIVQGNILVANQGIQQPYELGTTSTKGLDIPGLEISLFPNPTLKEFNLLVDFKSNPSLLEYNVFDLLGKKILEGGLEKGLNTVSVTQLPSGIGMVKILTQKNETQTFKLLKY